MNIKVVNKRALSDPLPGVRRAYVGRPSPLGNPFVIGPDGSRGDVVSKYRNWLGGHRNDANVKAELLKLYGMAQHGPLELICWCAPQSCHADVIKEALESMANERA